MSLNPKPGMPGNADQPAGSPTAGEPAFFEAGFIRRPHGVKGEVLAEIYPQYLRVMQPGQGIFLGETHLPIKLLSIRHHNQGQLILLEGLTNPEIAGQHRLQRIYVSVKQHNKYSYGEYYSDQLLGLRVRSDTDEDFGLLSEVIETGANDVYVVTSPEGREILLPAIQDVIREIDLEKGEILVHILPGLLEI
jgi:16S rRNA processing protein RimM